MNKQRIIIFVLFFSLFMTAFGFAENYISDDSFLKEPYDIQNSIVNHSTIDNTIVHNSNLSYSSVKDTNITGLELNYADVIDDVLVDGMIYNGDYTYFGPFLLSQIYDGISPFSIGYVELSKSKAKADDSVIIEYFGDGIGYNVSVTSDLCNIELLDDGNSPDITQNDAIYTAECSFVGATTGDKIITINIKDSLDNEFVLLTTVTIDANLPTITSMSPNSIPIPTLNDELVNIIVETNKDTTCRFSNTDKTYANSEYHMLGVGTNHYFSYIPFFGTNDIYVKCIDDVLNQVATDFSFSFDNIPPVYNLDPSVDLSIVHNGVVCLKFNNIVDVASKKVYINGNYYADLGSDPCAIGPSATNSLQLDTSFLYDGTHTFYIQAVDGHSNTGYSPVYSIKVDNTPASVYVYGPNENTKINENKLIEVIAGSDTITTQFETNCGTFSSEFDNDATDGFKSTWQIPADTTGCFYTITTYDIQGLVLATKTISGIEIDTTINDAIFTIPKNISGVYTLGNQTTFFNLDDDLLYIDFYVDDDFIQRLYSQNNFSYNFNTKSYVDGYYNLSIVLIDDTGNEKITYNSNNLVLFDNLAPVVTLIHEGSEFASEIISGEYNVTINAVDNYLEIDTYSFCIDGVCNTSSENNFSVDTLAYYQGTHIFQGCANDTLGNMGCSNQIFVYFDNNLNAKNTLILNPKNNQVVDGNITLYSVVPKNTYITKYYLNSTEICSKPFNEGYDCDLNTALYDDKIYELKVEVFDNLGNSLGYDEINLTFSNVIISKPTLSVTQQFDDDGVIILNWDAQDHVVEYRIYRTNNAFSNSSKRLIGTTTLLSFTDYLFSNGNYSYSVVGVNLAGDEGIYSNPKWSFVKLKLSSYDVELTKDIVKPKDKLGVYLYYSEFDEVTVSINLTSFGLETYEMNLISTQGAKKTYYYEFEIPYGLSDGNKELFFKITDLVLHESTYSKSVKYDSSSPKSNLNVNTVATAGFTTWNQTVTSIPMIYLDSSAYDSSSVFCFEKELVYLELFSNDSLQNNNKLNKGNIISSNDLNKKSNYFDYSLDITDDYIVELSSTLNKGTIYFDLAFNSSFEIDLESTTILYDKNTNNLSFFGDSYIVTDTIYKELTVVFNEDFSKLYLNHELIFTKESFSLSNISLVEGIFATFMISEKEDALLTINYKPCSTSVFYLTLEDGIKNIYLSTIDDAGNQNFTFSQVRLNKNASMLDITEPDDLEYVLSDDAYINSDDISFYWNDGYDREQRILQLPLTYHYIYHNVSDGGILEQGYTSETSISFNNSLSHGQIIALNVSVVNSAGLFSNYLKSNNVIVDLIKPEVLSINSSTHPNNTSWYASDYVFFNFSASDIGSYVESYAYDISSSKRNPALVFKNQTNVSYDLYRDGVYYFNLLAKDAAGNIGNLTSFVFNSDLTPPSRPVIKDLYQIENSTNLYLSWYPSVDYESDIDFYEIEYTKESGLIRRINTSNSSVLELNLTDISNNLSLVDAKIRAYDKVGHISFWSSQEYSDYDRNPPKFLYITPSGTVFDSSIKITVRTDKKSVCKFKINTSVSGSYVDFYFTNSTYHETLANLDETFSSHKIDVSCINSIGLSNTSEIIFNFDENLNNPDSLDVNSPETGFLGNPLTIVANVSQDGKGISGFSNDAFILDLIYSGSNSVRINQLSITDKGNGIYDISFEIPPMSMEQTVTFNLTVVGVSSSITKSFEVDLVELEFRVSLNESLDQRSEKMLYLNEDDYKLGLASDDDSLISVSGNDVYSNVGRGALYLFLVPPDNDVEHVNSKLYNQEFISSGSASFSKKQKKDLNSINAYVNYNNFFVQGDEIVSGKRRLVVENKGIREGRVVLEIREDNTATNQNIFQIE